MASSEPATSSKQPVHPLRLFCSACSYTAVQIAYGFAFALFSPMMDGLGVSSWINPIIWLLGPLCGLLQPIIGVLSDNSTFRWGRRRPFIVIGLSLVLFSYILFVLITEGIFKPNILAIIIGIIAFAIINVAINILMLPARTIVFDVAGANQEQLGNNFISLLIGAGNLISYLFAALLTKPYYYGMGLVVLVSIPTLLFAPEKPHVRKEGVKIENPFKKTFRALVQLFKGGPVLRAAIVFMMSWWTYFGFNTNATLYVATVVFHGINKVETSQSTSSLLSSSVSAVTSLFTSPDFISGFVQGISSSYAAMGQFGISPSPLVLLSANARREAKKAETSMLSAAVNTALQATAANDTPQELYRKGMMIGSFAIMALSLVTSIFSAISEPIQKFFGLRLTYFLTQLLCTISLFALFIPSDIDQRYIWLVFVAYCCIGFNFSMFNSVPFAVINQTVPSGDFGLYAGVMNIFCLIGQSLSQGMFAIINATVINPVAGRHQYQWDLLASAIISLFASFSSLLLTGKKKDVYTPLPNDPKTLAEGGEKSINADITANNPLLQSQEAPYQQKMG